ncbi:MAG: GTP cyclohydrolase II [Bacteriovoracaceae bacterium]|nr:GTP cyclohydrolase II [Bacteriovoracaceae bacterium]
MNIPGAQIRNRVSIDVKYGKSDFISFTNLEDSKEHIAIVFPDTLNKVIARKDTPLVRVHSECLTGDVFGSARCDCGDQLDDALKQISQEGGILIYLRQEGRGIGLYNKLDAYSLQDQGHDTFQANVLLGHGVDQRSYVAAAQILNALHVDKIKLLTNNPDKVDQLTKLGITIEEVRPTKVFLTPQNHNYLLAKEKTARHTLNINI